MRGSDSDAPARSDAADIAHVLAPPPLIYLFPLVVTLAVGVWQPHPPLSGVWPHLLGPPLLLAGILLLRPALEAFRAARTNPKPWKPTTALVVAGPYRLTRNPMYLGFTAIYLGIALWVNSLWPLLALPVVLAVMTVFVIKREERYLERKFGEPYREYCGRVRRWL